MVGGQSITILLAHTIVFVFKYFISKLLLYFHGRKGTLKHFITQKFQYLLYETLLSKPKLLAADLYPKIKLRMHIWDNSSRSNLGVDQIISTKLWTKDRIYGTYDHWQICALILLRVLLSSIDWQNPEMVASVPTVYSFQYKECQIIAYVEWIPFKDDSY